MISVGRWLTVTVASLVCRRVFFRHFLRSVAAVSNVFAKCTTNIRCIFFRSFIVEGRTNETVFSSFYFWWIGRRRRQLATTWIDEFRFLKIISRNVVGGKKGNCSFDVVVRVAHRELFCSVFVNLHSQFPSSFIWCSLRQKFLPFLAFFALKVFQRKCVKKRI